MIHRTLHRGWALMAPKFLLLLVAASIPGCSDPFEARDPTSILEDEVNNAEGAELLRRGALLQLFGAAGSAAWAGGLLADEFMYEQSAFFDGSSFPHDGPDLIDRRAGEDDQERVSDLPTGYDAWQTLRSRYTVVALEKLRRYARPGAREAHVGEMFAVRAYAAMRLAEDFCPGFPLHELVNFKQILGSPVSTQEAFEYALAAFDSALTWAADSARVRNFARVARARTLLQLGLFADAAATAEGVPTDYVYRAEYAGTGFFDGNPLASVPGWNEQWGVWRSVADREGGNGLDYVSAGDPRVPTILMGTARDGETGLYGAAKYPSRTSPIVLASGIEARLIEAEAALRANDPQWLTTLNDLRAASSDTALSNLPLTDPGTEAARVDLLFRERAFWLFATGTRLGDLRRLIRLYGRTHESVFPTGTYWRGGSYGPTTSLPFARQERDFGASGCTGS